MPHPTKGQAGAAPASSLQAGAVATTGGSVMTGHPHATCMHYACACTQRVITLTIPGCPHNSLASPQARGRPARPPPATCRHAPRPCCWQRQRWVTSRQLVASCTQRVATLAILACPPTPHAAPQARGRPAGPPPAACKQAQRPLLAAQVRLGPTAALLRCGHRTQRMPVPAFTIPIQGTWRLVRSSNGRRRPLGRSRQECQRPAASTRRRCLGGW